MVRKSRTRGAKQAEAADRQKRVAAAKKAGDEVRKKAAEGTTKPIPTDEPGPETDAAKERIKALEAKRKELERLQQEYKALKEKERAEARAKREAAKKAREEALAERVRKQKLIEAADAKIEKLQKALDAMVESSKEYKALQEAKKEREAIGPLPKVSRKRGGQGGGSRRYNGLTFAEVRCMEALSASSHALSRKELAEITGQRKGWSKMLGTKTGETGLVGQGLVKLVMHEDEPMRYSLTPSGKQALEVALREKAE